MARDPVGTDIVQGDQRCDHGIEDAFGDFRPVAVEDRLVGHQVADIAHQQQAPAVQRQLRAVGRGIDLRSGLSLRVKVLPPLKTSAVKSPFIRPSQLR